MNSRKFMLIALILLSMIKGGNPRDIFTGASVVIIDQLYPGLRDAFIRYATNVATTDVTEAGQEALQALQVEVAAYQSLSQPGAFVSYFERFDGQMMQEIFEGSLPTQDEVSQVWGMMTSFFKSLGLISNNALEFISSIQSLVSRNPLAALNALAQLAMVANCLKILYSGTKVVCDMVGGACSAASNCGRITIKTLRGIVGLFRTSAASAAPAGGIFASETPEAVTLLSAVENHRELPDEVTIDNILCLDCTLSGSQYVDLIHALTANNLYTPPPAGSPGDMQRSCSLMNPLPRDILSQFCSRSEEFPPPPKRSNSQYENPENGITFPFPQRKKGGTKKHLKKKQRKSVRKQRKTKRSKRGRSRKSRRYKK